ncbi:uncharacterized protein PGTG_21983 [Puccinia graminis f. sp. tritici CRL 75-36-700-3]|uniref:Uncharacterized protein n=1 Tax=Puccinia graminis f. sp. tritici (strain CRL 75-36-700-3 / race SCCL) TaxID=418459 RepID=H6QT23_PUCGT|nr:uncharacterized protein PGTG_21983 [Puccinia graminis f. sp. tritici CRL 75-36-700-3]EHS63980.1 hypothetical protein PGTG_21983 [Puccinia graminis f. sp. tritici CRL 75-36-700-3]
MTAYPTAFRFFRCTRFPGTNPEDPPDACRPVPLKHSRPARRVAGVGSHPPPGPLRQPGKTETGLVGLTKSRGDGSFNFSLCHHSYCQALYSLVPASQDEFGMETCSGQTVNNMRNWTRTRAWPAFLAGIWISSVLLLQKCFLVSQDRAVDAVVGPLFAGKRKRGFFRSCRPKGRAARPEVRPFLISVWSDPIIMSGFTQPKFRAHGSSGFACSLFSSLLKSVRSWALDEEDRRAGGSKECIQPVSQTIKLKGWVVFGKSSYRHSLITM